MFINKIFISKLEFILPKNQVLTDPGECWAYGYDNSRQHALPEAVVFPTTHEEVVSIVKLCNEYKVPLVVRGRGTSTTGSAVPLYHGIVLSTEKMNRIIKVDPDNRALVAQPGVTNQAVQLAAQKVGFMWPPDPTSSAYCTIGGNLAVNAGGPRAVKYGTTHENTLALKVVTGSGEYFYTGSYTTKGVVGYALMQLVIGSEGTLAIITEATLKLTPLPEMKATLQATYASIEAATYAITKLMSQPITPCALEFLDEQAINLIRPYSTIPLPINASAMLLIEVDGSKTALAEIIVMIEKVARVEGTLNIIVANNEEQIQAIWATRKALSPALRNLAPNKINEDVVVPVSRIPKLLNHLQMLSKKYGISIVNFGHAGNGNIHVNLLFNGADKTQEKHAKSCLNDVFDIVLKLEGTLSGEHGIGMLKQAFIDREISPSAINLMIKIKQQFDPNGILNPGKIFPNTIK